MANRYLTLVADDSEDERFLIGYFLRRIPGVSPIGSVRDGIETLYYLQGTGEFGDREKFPFPDILLLDYQMPRLNGIEVLACVETLGIRPHIVLWSNMLELVDPTLARALGAEVVCQKPLNTSEMIAIINGLGLVQPKTNVSPISIAPICKPIPSFPERGRSSAPAMQKSSTQVVIGR